MLCQFVRFSERALQTLIFVDKLLSSGDIAVSPRDFEMQVCESVLHVYGRL